MRLYINTTILAQKPNNLIEANLDVPVSKTSPYVIRAADKGQQRNSDWGPGPRL